MARLGTAIPGFFDYSKYCILIMVLTVLVYSIYNFVHYTKSNHCRYGEITFNKVYCGAKWKFYMSSASFSDQYVDSTERILYIVAMLLIYAVKVY